MRNTDHGASVHGLDAYNGGGGISLRRVLLEQNLFENAGYRLFQITLGHDGAQQDIQIVHNTVWSNNPGLYPSAIAIGDTTPVVSRLVINNNVFVPGLAGYSAIGSGQGFGKPSMDYYAPGYDMRGNALVVLSDGANSIPNNTYTTRTAGGFVNSAGNNFKLVTSSPLKGTATDGTDPGADIDAVLIATNGSVSGVWSGTYVPPPPPPPVPTLSFSASPLSITSGQSSTLSWSSTNVTGCTASGGWTGSKATSGTQLVTPTVTTIYTLSCTGSGGTTNQSTTVSVSTVSVSPSAKFIIGDRVQVSSGPQF
jgi:hypothetical protein